MKGVTTEDGFPSFMVAQRPFTFLRRRGLGSSLCCAACAHHQTSKDEEVEGSGLLLSEAQVDHPELITNGCMQHYYT